MLVAIVIPVVTCYLYAKTHLDEETKTGKKAETFELEKTSMKLQKLFLTLQWMVKFIH